MAEPSVANVRPILLLAGTEREDMQLALQRLQVHAPIDGRANAEIALVNWGRRDGATDFQWLDIALGDRLGIAFLDTASPVFAGEITAIEERYGEGAPMLVLLVEDALHRLAKRRRSRVFASQSADDAIQSVAGDHGLASDVSVSGASSDWHQLNETDLGFVQRLAACWDIAVRIRDGALRVRPEEDDARPVAVSPQANAQQIRICADLNHQARASGVRGWDFRGGNPIEDSAERLQPPPVGATAAGTLADLGWGEAEWLGRPRPSSADEARAWAAAAFRRQATRFLSGDLLLQGNPALRVGGEVELAEVSPRLAGRYRVVHLCHRFDSANGFVSHVRVQRPHWGPSS
jgi:uncharacterized protein